MGEICVHKTGTDSHFSMAMWNVGGDRGPVFLFISFAWPAFLYCEDCVYIHTLFCPRRYCIWIYVATK